MKHLVLFDIDGTLLRAKGAGKIAYERAFSELFGVDNAWSQLNAHGRTDRDIIDELCEKTLGRLLKPEEQLSLERRFIQYFDEILWEHPNFDLMPGTPELLRQLGAHPEVALGIETGNLKETADIKLRRAEFNGYFEIGGYGSDSQDRREIVSVAISRAREHFSLPEQIEITVIGDSVNDVVAAHANGAKAIAVSTGGVTEEHFGAHTEAELITKDLSETGKMLSFILESQRNGG